VRTDESDQACFAITHYKKNIQYYNEAAQVKYWNTTEKTKFSFDFRTVVGHGEYTYFLFVFNHTHPIVVVVYLACGFLIAIVPVA
jgi:hypothetical protein